MSKFTIQPHGRLNDWVAEEKGYFKDEGLDYYINVNASYKTVPQLPEAIEEGAEIKDNLFVTVKFVAEVISVKKDKDNKIFA